MSKVKRKAASFMDSLPAIDDYDILRETVVNSDCKQCELHNSRNKIVFDRGQHNGVVVIAEAPGKNEDAEGVPFVGAAGKLLDKMLTKAGFDPTKLLITNPIRCRPPNNRDPRPDELKACYPILKRQFELLAPKMILILGKTATRALLEPGVVLYESGVGKSLKELVDKRFIRPLFRKCDTFIIWHPAYCLYNPLKKVDWIKYAKQFARLCRKAKIDGVYND